MNENFDQHMREEIKELKAFLDHKFEGLNRQSFMMMERVIRLEMECESLSKRFGGVVKWWASISVGVISTALSGGVMLLLK